MKDISQLQVSQVRIFPMDVFPLVRLLSPPVGRAFKDRFGWSEVVDAGDGEVAFQRGMFPAREGKNGTVIKSLQIDDRRMILTVFGDSATGNVVYKGLLAFLVEATRWTPSEPVILTEETACVATLDFDWTALLSAQLLEFAEGGMLEATSHKAGRAEVKGLSLSFQLTYSQVAPEIREHGITLADKAVTIEPRVNTPLSQRRYYTYSPTDSRTHLGLLEELERIVMAPDGRSRRVTEKKERR